MTNLRDYEHLVDPSTGSWIPALNEAIADGDGDIYMEPHHYPMQPDSTKITAVLQVERDRCRIRGAGDATSLEIRLNPNTSETGYHRGIGVTGGTEQLVFEDFNLWSSQRRAQGVGENQVHKEQGGLLFLYGSGDIEGMLIREILIQRLRIGPNWNGDAIYCGAGTDRVTVRDNRFVDIARSMVVFGGNGPDRSAMHVIDNRGWLQDMDPLDPLGGTPGRLVDIEPGGSGRLREVIIRGNTGPGAIESGGCEQLIIQGNVCGYITCVNTLDLLIQGNSIRTQPRIVNNPSPEQLGWGIQTLRAAKRVMISDNIVHARLLTETSGPGGIQIQGYPEDLIGVDDPDRIPYDVTVHGNRVIVEAPDRPAFVAGGALLKDLWSGTGPKPPHEERWVYDESRLHIGKNWLTGGGPTIESGHYPVAPSAGTEPGYYVKP